jgi:hypothetical protein
MSGKGVEKFRLLHERAELLYDIGLQLAGRAVYLLDEGRSAVNNSYDVFDIVAHQEIAHPTAFESFELGGDKGGAID